MGFPVRGFRGWRALRHHNYRLFFVGQLVSLIGTWMQTVAQGWLVLELTGDPFHLGVVAAAQFAPVLFLGLFGGLIADHLPKRRTLIATQIAAMLLAFALFALTATHVVQVWHIEVLALLLGVTNAIDMPTRQAFAMEMVGREDMVNAVALNSSVFNGARVIGPAVAGLTIGATDISVAFLLNGISFLAVIAAYLAMRDEELAQPPRLARPGSVAEVRANLAEGIRYVLNAPMVLLAVLVVGLVSTFGMNFSVVVPAFAKDVLGVGATGYGFLMSATGVGSLSAALAIAFGGRNRPVLIALGGIAVGITELLLATTQTFALSMVLFYFVGLSAIAMAATANTTIQLAVPDGLRGRVMSVYTTIFVGSTPLGGLLIGGLASRFDIPVAVAVGGAGSLVVGLAALVWYRRLPAAIVSAAGSADGRAGAGGPAAARPSTARG